MTPLRRIAHPLGEVLHAMKHSDVGCSGFGEAYFTTVHRGAVKAWKKHLRMRLNLVVAVGEVRFVLHDDRERSLTRGSFGEIVLGPDALFARLTVPPALWLGFQGRASGLNLVLNLADLEHDPAEVRGAALGEIPFPW